jgi:hypothetical protein
VGLVEPTQHTVVPGQAAAATLDWKP